MLKEVVSVLNEKEGDIIARIVVEMCGNEEMAARGWRVNVSSIEKYPWIYVLHQDVEQRQQGWKLHISAASSSIKDVLSAALPVLLTEPTCFKVIASLEQLRRQSQGKSGLSQVGKCITIYPADDEQAVRLAHKLDQATRGLRGPAVRSDRPLHRGSLVHYRYGSFMERLAYQSNGTLFSTVESPTGELIEDRRDLTYHAPAWVEDPFLAAGVSEKDAADTSLLRGQYLFVAPIHHSATGIVYDAVDLKQAQRCVLKGAYRDAALTSNFRDARDMLRNEAHILARLSTISSIPRVYDFFADGDNEWLALEYVEGTVLNRYIGYHANKGETVPFATLMRWAQSLVEVLDQIHQQQIVYRDLKGINTIVTPGENLRLLDFGIAHDLTSSEPQFHGGTRGCSSPQQLANEPATVADDIYSLGALFYFLATGAEPYQAPHEALLLERPLAEINPQIPSSFCHLVARCLAPDPRDRYSTMQEVGAELQRIKDVSTVTIADNLVQEPASEAERYYRYAQELAETLCVVVQTAIEGKGPTWALLKRSPDSAITLRDFGSGLAGVLFVLAAFVERLDSPHLRTTLHTGAHWLLHAKRLAGYMPPGLLSGEAGVGVALARAGHLLEDSTLVAAAEERGRLVAASPYGLYDIFHGTAGRVKYHLILWHSTGKAEHLQEAMRAGKTLLEQAEEDVDGMYWRVPQGHKELSGKVYSGYGHGVAGVADALLDLYQATECSEFLTVAQRAGDWLVERAVAVGREQQGLGWPELDKGEVCGAFYCHGSSGIARFFLHAAQHQHFPQAMDLARGAAKAVADGTRWATPIRCHGLAGNIELLLDMYEVTREQEWLDTAYIFAHLLEASTEVQDGMRVWLAENPEMITPGFLSGYAGIGETLLRLGTIARPIRSQLPRFC